MLSQAGYAMCEQLSIAMFIWEAFPVIIWTGLRE